MPEWVIALIGILSPIIVEVIRELLTAPDTAETGRAPADLRKRLIDRVRERKDSVRAPR